MQLISKEPPDIVGGLRNEPGVDTFWQFSDQGLSPVVFTGSSQMQAGLSPHLFDDAVKTLSGRSILSVNVSITGASTTVTRHLIQELFIPAGVKTIIYGIEMRALNVRAQSEEVGFADSPLGYVLARQQRVEQTTLLWLLRHSNLIRYRNNIRDWLSGARAKDRQEYVADDRGFVPGDRAYVPSPVSAPNWYVWQFTPFTISEPLQNSLTEIAVSCQANGVRCILVNMPLHEDAYLSITPQEAASYQNVIDEFIARSQLPFWDLNTQACRLSLGSDGFQDGNHLNTTGARRFTEALAILYLRETTDNPNAVYPEPDLVHCGKIFEPRSTSAAR